MFTAFRFMLGDYSSQAGHSLAVAFTKRYGVPFQTTFVAGMIIVIFGLFNIITAVFVETTISGLKTNETKRKYANQYEKRYVRWKLRRLLELCQESKDSEPTHRSTKLRKSIPLDFQKRGVIEPRAGFTDQEFRMIMQKPGVQEVLRDLDVVLHDIGNLFETFDPDNTGKVTMQQLANGIMKVRGDPHKTDIIASWVAIRALHQKFDQLQYWLLVATGGRGQGSEDPERAGMGAATWPLGEEGFLRGEDDEGVSVTASLGVRP